MEEGKNLESLMGIELDRESTAGKSRQAQQRAQKPLDLGEQQQQQQERGRHHRHHRKHNHTHHHHYNQRQLPDQWPRAREEDEQGSLMNEQAISRDEDRQFFKGKAGPHRSQSSPSSLTTHKFGLRPTPSPPRLIIDHQTGDIIESYPEQPVYLRTYQPLDCSEATTVTAPSEDLEFCSLLQAHLAQPWAQPAPPGSAPGRSGLPAIESNKSDGYNRPIQEATNMSRSSSSSRAASNIIPPPHSASNASRVYFAPPVPSGAAATTGHHLFPSADGPRTINHQRQLSDEDDHQLVASTSGSDLSVFNAALGQQPPYQRQARDRIQTGSHNSSFKRALNKLDYGNHPQLISSGGKTDIAIVTEPAGASLPAFCGQQVGPGINVVSSGAIANSKAHQHKQQSELFEGPTIESFRLYNFCFVFTLLLALALSAFIIYLLVKPLNMDCMAYRPTYAYISTIVASVNLTCLTIFSLFWFCSGVTRALYANLSSSGFIITSYSILVAINLALAIMFFFINTCHYQKIAHARPALVQALVIDKMATSELRPEALRHLSAPGGQEHSVDREHPSFERWRRQDDTKSAKLAALTAPKFSNENQDYDDDDKDDDQPDTDYQEQDNSNKSVTPNMSPIEAAWEYLRERALLMRRSFLLFLANYDLRLIGALHALCAVCLQYLAIRVAVVRSYFCSPAHI